VPLLAGCQHTSNPLPHGIQVHRGEASAVEINDPKFRVDFPGHPIEKLARLRLVRRPGLIKNGATSSLGRAQQHGLSLRPPGIRIHLKPSGYTGSVLAPAARLQRPAVDSEGRLVQHGDRRIGRVNPDGTHVTRRPFLGARFNSPTTCL
jgi:hypothetical protein